MPHDNPKRKKTKGVEFFLIFWQILKRDFGKKNSSYQKKIPKKKFTDLDTYIVSFYNPPKPGWVFRKT
jgi:hypothetical protein